MKEKNIRIKLLTLCLFVLFGIGCIYIDRTYFVSKYKKTVLDTLVIRDTVYVDSVVYKTKYINHYIYLEEDTTKKVKDTKYLKKKFCN